MLTIIQHFHTKAALMICSSRANLPQVQTKAGEIRQNRWVGLEYLSSAFIWLAYSIEKRWWSVTVCIPTRLFRDATWEKVDIILDRKCPTIGP
jgi:hypothetical protein